jgi:hypothetical protein
MLRFEWRDGRGARQLFAAKREPGTHPARFERRARYSRTSILPVFAPVKSPMKAAGAFSSPS